MTSCTAADRKRRYRERVKRHEAMGRFLITERLISKLVQDGEITDTMSTSVEAVEIGVARVLENYVRS